MPAKTYNRVGDADSSFDVATTPLPHDSVIDYDTTLTAARTCDIVGPGDEPAHRIYLTRTGGFSLDDVTYRANDPLASIGTIGGISPSKRTMVYDGTTWAFSAVGG